MEYEKAVRDAEMRKIFPTLEEQMDKLAPELQVELYKMEERYDREIQTARTIRKEILDTTHDLFEANFTCSGWFEMPKNQARQNQEITRNLGRILL